MFKIIKRTQSNLGKEIKLLEITPNKYKKSILIIGVFHGDELEGEFLINQFLEQITNNKYSVKNRFFIIPCLNPDGKEKKIRQNANLIDLNRNFPTDNWELSDNPQYFGGNKPNSEPETKFIVEILSEIKPDLILTLHSPYKIVNYDGNAHHIAKEISKITGYPVESNIGYPTPGSFGTYAGIERDIPTITLELPDNETKQTLWDTNKLLFKFLAEDFE